MIKFEYTEVVGWEHSIRGMRNPKNSWEKSDSKHCDDIACEDCPGYGDCPSPWDDMHGFVIGPNDHELMMKLGKAGSVHGKYRRMIEVYVDITAPLYWWKEFDTYKVGTVANSCSTMHKIHAKEFTSDDFSLDHLDEGNCEFFTTLLYRLNAYRVKFLETGDKTYWWQMIQLLPSSYNQRRTVMLSYEVLANMYEYRYDHKLDEWRELCKWIESLPYSEIITGKVDG